MRTDPDPDGICYVVIDTDITPEKVIGVYYDASGMKHSRVDLHGQLGQIAYLGKPGADFTRVCHCEEGWRVEEVPVYTNRLNDVEKLDWSKFMAERAR